MEAWAFVQRYVFEDVDDRQWCVVANLSGAFVETLIIQMVQEVGIALYWMDEHGYWSLSYQSVVVSGTDSW